MNLKDLPLKVIITISVKLLKSNKFNYSDPYNDHDKNYKELANESRWTGAEIKDDDVEFMGAFIIQNEELLQSVADSESTINYVLPIIDIPKKEDYKVDYSVYGNARVTEQYKTTWSSYDESFVADSIRHSYFEGDFVFWDGKLIKTDTEDYDVEEFVVDDTEIISESKTKKPLVESTKKVIDSLDKETLLQLKKIIDSKLDNL